MSWNHTTTNLSVRCRKRSEISEGNKLYVSIVRSILRPNRSSEFMRYFGPLRLIFQFTLQAVNISNISFIEKLPRGKVLHEAVWEIWLKTRSQKNCLLFSFSFPFLFFSYLLLFGCFFQLFNCLPTLLQKAAPVVIVIWMLPVKPVFQREDIAVCVSRNSLASIAK